MQKLQSNMQGSMKKIQSSTTDFQSKVSGTVGKVGAIFASLAIGSYIKSSVAELSNMQAGIVGLHSVANGMGRSFSQAQKFIDEFTSDGIVPATDAITAYKNLLSRGYDDKQIQSVMNRLKDSAAFGRRSSLSYGEAIRSATEGLKNENSLLVDNVGVTKNVSKMWEDYAKSIGTTANKLTKQQKIQAEVSGIMEETKFQIGDATRYATTYAGETAKLSKNFLNLKIAVGGIFMPIAQLVIPYISAAVSWVTKLAQTIGNLVQAVTGKGGFTVMATDTASVASGLGDIGGSAIEAGDEVAAGAKKAKGALAGFDEVNVLQQSSGGGNDESLDSGKLLPNLTQPTDITNFESPKDIFTPMTKELENLAKLISFIGNLIQKNIIEPFKQSLFLNIDFGVVEKIQENLDKIKFNVGRIFSSQDLSTALTDLISSNAAVMGTLVGIVETLVMDVENAFMGAVCKWIAEKGNTIQESLVDIFNVGKRLNETLTNAFSGFGNIIRNVLKNENLQEIGADILGIFSDIGLGFAELGLDYANSFLDAFTGGILDNATKIEDAINGTIDIGSKLTDTLGKAVSDAMDSIKKSWEEHGKPAFDNIREGWSMIVGSLVSNYNEHILPVIDGFANKFGELYNNHLKDKIDHIISKFGEMGENISILWAEVIAPFIATMVDVFSPQIGNAISIVGDCITNFLSVVTRDISLVMDILSGLLEFITGVFTGDWGKAWQGLQDVFKGIWEGILQIGKDTINLLIGAINVMISSIVLGVNAVIKALNTISVDIPEWVPGFGGRSFGINLSQVTAPQIPFLAKGGIVTKPTLAMVGERGREAVMPLENNTGGITELANQLSAVMSMNSGGNSSGNAPSTINLHIDGRKFAEATIDDLKNVATRRGITLIPNNG